MSSELSLFDSKTVKKISLEEVPLAIIGAIAESNASLEIKGNTGEIFISARQQAFQRALENLLGPDGPAYYWKMASRLGLYPHLEIPSLRSYVDEVQGKHYEILIVPIKN